MSKFKFQSLLCPSEKVTEEQLATERRVLAFDKEIAQWNRRGFLGAFAASVVAAVAVGGKDAIAQTATPAITDVLNFALNLEYLEATLYLSISGGTLSSADMGSGAGSLGGAPGKIANLSTNSLAIATALAADEVHHIELLRSTITMLGATPISMPTINLAAKGAITTEALFLATARQFTAVGGSAYAGSAQYLVSNTTVLTTAAQILGTEGQHAGAVNYACENAGVVSPAVDANDYPPSSSNYFTVAPVTALSPVRTTSQVLGIVYGLSTSATTTPAAGTTVGGFFPNGVNGNIHST